MPLVIHPRVRKVVRRVAALTCLAMFAGTGAAFASPCGHQATSTPFAQFGDTNSYFLVPGGDFESTTAETGWTLDNASLTTADSPAAAGIGTEDQSLLIDGGGTAVSPVFCLDSTMPTIRFLAKQPTTGADLRVDGLVTMGRRTFTVPIATIPDGTASAWGPVATIKLPDLLLPKWIRIPVRLELSVAPGSGSWQVGDVYVDPYRSA